MIIEIPLEPASASRPRVARWGVFYAKPYANWKKAAEKYCAALPATEAVPANTSLLVFVESVFTKARTSKLVRPTPDVDNTAKGPLDAITKAEHIWVDDKLVTTLVSTKRFKRPGEEARTRVSIYRAPTDY